MMLGMSADRFSPSSFVSLDHTEHRVLFEAGPFVWDALGQIASYLKFRLKPAVLGTPIGKPFISHAVFIGPGTTIEPGAVIKGPAWIGSNCEIRSGCYIRENVIVGDNCVLGNSCEFKNSIIFNDAQIPHFNYVGDSILGHASHLGAGVILSNVRLDRKEVLIPLPEGGFQPSGLRKFGAVIGDHAEIGCNSVINPGSLIGPGSLLYPGTQWRGILPANRVVKWLQPQEITERPSRSL
jgi:NDP-sugar pyrophosphorylase family protein